jgi:hypothetical protein|tara:strand:+ start:611 stop:829 length:219 start_codon:yes stop_codon:yes gene_type:complete
MRRELLDALRARYEAEIAEANATINIYLTNSVGIGEHPQHLEEMDKLIDKIAQAEEKIEVLEKFEPAKGAML